MYIPGQFVENDVGLITDLIKSTPFGMLITQFEGKPCISHLPFMFEPASGSHGTLIGHMAKDNPQWKSLMGNGSVTVVFNGVNGYVSPAWYSSPGVPTWNYVAVHLQGNPSVAEDPVGVESILQKLTTYFETSQAKPWEFNFPADKAKLLPMIVGFEIAIQTIEAKFKLSQNRTADEQQNIIHELAKSPRHGDIELARFMADYFA